MCACPNTNLEGALETLARLNAEKNLFSRDITAVDTATPPAHRSPVGRRASTELNEDTSTYR